MPSLRLIPCLLIAVPLLAQPAPRTGPAGPRQRQYDNNCAVCHGADGAGGELAPSILARLPNRSDTELAAYRFDGKEYIAVAAGQNILAFGLVE